MAIHIQRREFITLRRPSGCVAAATAPTVGKIARIGIFAGAANAVIAAVELPR
jgi:hypothetical protein